MKDQTDLQKLFGGIIERYKQTDGKVIGEDNDFIESKLSPDDRSAWVSHLAEQYLKKEKLDKPPSGMEITHEDIVNELASREIDKILGN